MFLAFFLLIFDAMEFARQLDVTPIANMND